MKASDLMVKCLEEEGIEYIFGVPGEENADFMMSLEQSSQIKFVLTRHEQGADVGPNRAGQHPSLAQGISPDHGCGEDV